MNATAENVTESTDLILPAKLDPVALFEKGGLQELLQKVEKNARALVPDATTKQGLEEIRSLAYRITRSKTTLDNLGKDFVAEIKKTAAKTDEQRRYLRTFLEELAADIRLPLTEWEAARDKAAKLIEQVKALSHFERQYTSAEIEELIGKLDVLSNESDALPAEYLDEFSSAVDQTSRRLTAALEDRRKLEAIEAEEKRLAEEQAAREAEEKRKAEEERIRKEAEEKARAEAEAKAKAEAEAREREHQEELRKERKAREKAEREAEEAKQQHRLGTQSDSVTAERSFSSAVAPHLTAAAPLVATPSTKGTTQHAGQPQAISEIPAEEDPADEDRAETVKALQQLLDLSYGQALCIVSAVENGKIPGLRATYIPYF